MRIDWRVRRGGGRDKDDGKERGKRRGGRAGSAAFVEEGDQEGLAWSAGSGSCGVTRCVRSEGVGRLFGGVTAWRLGWGGARRTWEGRVAREWLHVIGERWEGLGPGGDKAGEELKRMVFASLARWPRYSILRDLKLSSFPIGARFQVCFLCSEHDGAATWAPDSERRLP